MDLVLNNQQRFICHKTRPTNQYLHLPQKDMRQKILTNNLDNYIHNDIHDMKNDLWSGIRIFIVQSAWGGGLLNTPTAPLQRGKTYPNKCPGYDIKQSDVKVPVKLDLWATWRIFSLPSLQGQLWLGVVGWPGSDGNDGVLRIPQSSSTAGTSSSDCFVSYPGHSLGRGSYPSAEK